MEPRDLFEILVRENADMVRAYLLCHVRDPATVEDLLQEAFLTAWRILDRYDRQLPFGPWVRGIAAKLLLNHRRKMGRSKVWFCDEESMHVMEEAFCKLQTLKGDTFDEKLDHLRVCLEKLNAVQRDAIRMHYEHGLQCKEIATRTGTGFEAVKKHLQRGRAALLRCMEGRAVASGAPS